MIQHLPYEKLNSNTILLQCSYEPKRYYYSDNNDNCSYDPVKLMDRIALTPEYSRAGNKKTINYEITF